MTRYSSYTLYLLISILVVILYVNGIGPLDNLQRSVNDSLGRMTASEGPRPNIVIVEIDGRAQDEFGSWPWNHDLIADLAAATASAEPAVVVLDLNLSENAAQDSAGYTDILAGQLSWIDRIVLPYDIALSTYRPNRTSTAKYLFNNSISVNNPLGIISDDASLLTRKVFLPAEKLLVNQPFLGFEYVAPDNDRLVRHQPLIVHYDGYYYPSLALVSAAAFLKIPPSDVKVIEGSMIEMGFSNVIPINRQSELFVNYATEQAFTTYSAADILTEGFDFNRLKGKLVLIGPDRISAFETFDTPMNQGVTPLFVTATVIENIINNNFVEEKASAAVLDMLILFILGGACAFLLPRVSLVHRMLILAGGLFLLANISYFMLSSFRIIAETLYFAFELVLFMAAAPLLDSQLITGEAGTKEKVGKGGVPKPKPKVIESPEEDIPVREIPNSTATIEAESGETLAIEPADEEPIIDDYSSITLDEPEMEKTEAVNSSDQISFADEELVTSSGSVQPPEPQDEVTPSASAGTPDAEPPQSDLDKQITESQKLTAIDASKIKNLGRYQISGVLGKGAMGLVYRGIDPAINRPVALKTIRLDFVNDPEEMEELKERLHREAQAAGKLSHPNIVTIYDVGSEGQLQYIAMEFLEGVTLEEMIKKNTKFNYKIIAQIIVQICDALEYAHDQGIIHRDVKPANIMVLKDYRVKVMDYGIARIDSNSMTKTGIAMGTPNYISPEQLKGLRPDRRGDIFSLGVVMYEMLLGRRPFRGENITSLIYSIINTEPDKPSNINPQIPLIYDRILERALAKDPGERFQKASEVADALKDFVESFASR